MLKNLSLFLLAVSLQVCHCRRLAEQLDNDINMSPNDIDYGKRVMDWVRIIVPPISVEKSAGSTFELECEAMGSPAPTIRWLKGNTEIGYTDDDNLANNMINDNPSSGMAKVRSRLVVRSALSVHKGYYHCVAESGSQVASAMSEVMITSRLIPERNFSKLLTEELIKLKNQPRITLYDVIYMDNIGSDIVLPCKVSGNPKPTILWLDPSEQVIDNDPRFTVLPDGQLRIRNIRWNDMGPYSCVARNGFGQDNITTFLYPMLAEK